MTNTDAATSKPALDVSAPFPSSNPYERGRLMVTVNCPVDGCAERVTVDQRDTEGLLRGSISVMHTASEHWTRVYWGYNEARIQYAH